MGHTKKWRIFVLFVIAYLCVKWSDAWLSFEESRARSVAFFFFLIFFLMIRLFLLCEMSAIFQLNFAKDDTFINFAFCVLNCNRGCEFESLEAQNFIPIQILVVCSLNRKGKQEKQKKQKQMCVTTKKKTTKIRWAKTMESTFQNQNNEFPRPFPGKMCIMGCVTVNAELRQAWTTRHPYYLLYEI